VNGASQLGVQPNCYPVQEPVIVVYTTYIPTVFEIVAFTFDIRNTPVVVPMKAVEKIGNPNKKVDGTASTWLKFFEGLLLREAKKALGNANVKISEVKSVFAPLCSTAYVVFRTSETSGVRTMAKPIMVTSSYDQATQYVVSTVVGSVQRRTKAPSYYVSRGLVRFFFTPDQVTSFMYAMLGE